MLHTSLTTIMMAVMATSLLLILVTLCLSNKSIQMHSGYRILLLFVAFTALRLLIPVEFPFTKTVMQPELISRFAVIAHYGLFSVADQSVSVWLIFKIVWLLGSIVGFFLYLLSYFRFRYQIILYGKELTNTVFYKALTDSICGEVHRKNRFRIIEMPGLEVPVLFGIFSPRILIPEHMDISSKETYYSVRHEMFHSFHHDLLLKNIIKLITLIYWWNPFCVLLNRQTDIILEMRIDDSLTTSDSKLTCEYVDCLLNVSRKASSKKSCPHSLVMQLIPSTLTDLDIRVYTLSGNQEKRNRFLNGILLTGVVLLFMCSYLFIWEPYTQPDNLLFEDVEDTAGLIIPSKDTSYFIDNGDGSYDFYSDGRYLETTTSLEFYLSDIPIYTTENCPK